MRWWRWIIGAGVVGGIGVVAATIAWPIGAPVSDLTLQGDAQRGRIWRAPVDALRATPTLKLAGRHWQEERHSGPISGHSIRQI